MRVQRGLLCGSPAHTAGSASLSQRVSQPSLEPVSSPARMSMNEDDLNRASAKAARAKNLLENELLTEAFKTLEETYTQAWRNTTVNEVNGREKLFLAINIVGKVRDHLANVVNNGALAQAELKALAQTAERRKRFGVL